MFTAPTAFRSIKKEGPHLRAIRPREISDAVPRRRARRPRHPGLGGEVIEETGDRPLVADRDRVGDYRQSGRPRAIAGEARFVDGGDARLRRKLGSSTVAMPGYDVRVVDESCKAVPANTLGSIVVKLPLAPACLPTLWDGSFE